MATTANLSAILRFYSEKQKSAFIDLHDFCAYLKKYAEHHVEEQAELVKYLGDPVETVIAELTGLAEKHLATLITVQKKKVIVAFSYYATPYTQRFKEILSNDSLPYPVVSDLPKQFPTQELEKKMADEYIKEILEKQDLKSPYIYSIVFNKEIPAMVLPACVPVKVIIQTAHDKIRRILKKEEFHDYFLKKMRSSNPGKEMTIQRFFKDFVANKPHEEGIEQMSQGDDFFYWGQLCYHIRQDFLKIQDKTIEDVNILQAIEFSEIYNSYLKTKMVESQKRREALNSLRANLAKPPFFYSMDQILKFKDDNGKVIYGSYSNDDLKEFLTHTTTEAEEGKLPELLVFKVDSGTRYYVFKSKVMHLVVRLCDEAHNFIEKKLENRWYDCLYNYNKLPEMTDGQAFEKALEKEVSEQSPVLYALINSAFMKVIPYETENGQEFEGFHIYNGTELQPLSEMLMLKQSQILANAKFRLPFWYTMPIISWIVAMFAGGKKRKSQKKNKSKNGGILDEKTMDIDQALELEEAKKKKNVNPKSKKEALSEKAKEITSEFIPEGSSLERELDYLNKQWNKMISKEANFQLTEDVNALIRDYVRKVIGTMSTVSFTPDRVKSLAKSLVKTPNMQKIKEENALQSYIELYIIKLVRDK